MSALARRSPRPVVVDCESCGRRPATAVLRVDGTAPFVVCSGCLPDDARHPNRTVRRTAVVPPVAPQSVRAATSDDAIPPLDWAGTVRVRQPWTSIAQPVGLLLAVAVLCAAVYVLGGRTNEAAMAMVAIGTIAAPAVGVLDRWLLRGRCPRWTVHRQT